jgi:hypothetical protein
MDWAESVRHSGPSFLVQPPYCTCPTTSKSDGRQPNPGDVGNRCQRTATLEAQRPTRPRRRTGNWRNGCCPGQSRRGLERDQGNRFQMGFRVGAQWGHSGPQQIFTLAVHSSARDPIMTRSDRLARVRHLSPISIWSRSSCQKPPDYARWRQSSARSPDLFRRARGHDLEAATGIATILSHPACNVSRMGRSEALDEPRRSACCWEAEDISLVEAEPSFGRNAHSATRLVCKNRTG